MSSASTGANGGQYRIRSYAPGDREACLDILDGNTPEFFVSADRNAFAKFLDNRPGPYVVMEEHGTIVACGGWAIESQDVAVLTWGLIRRDLQRRGIGRRLLHHRLADLRADGRANTVRIRTVQLVQEFFAREGFALTGVVANGFGKGLDQVTMELRLHS
jgi:N-acetylglutamate synthase-like GNAT family acetyltransferase